MSEKEKQIQKMKIDLEILKGGFIGTLEGILWYDIPDKLRIIIKDKIKELRDKQYIYKH